VSTCKKRANIYCVVVVVIINKRLLFLFVCFSFFVIINNRGVYVIINKRAFLNLFYVFENTFTLTDVMLLVSIKSKTVFQTDTLYSCLLSLVSLSL